MLVRFVLVSISALGWSETRLTEVIHYTPPSGLPAASKPAECWTSSVAAFHHAGAWGATPGT
jgi:hypothetical protein